MGNPHARFGERRLMLIVLGASLAGYALTFLLVALTGTGKATAVNDLPSPPRFRWMPPRTAAREPDPRYLAADLFDPSLLSLPSARGFTGGLWLHGPAPAHQPADWRLGPAFVAAPTAGEFRALLDEPPLAALVQATAEKAAVEAPEPTNETIELPPWPNQSVLRVVAGLEERAILKPVALPTVVSDTALRPTLVRVGVGADGLVRYAILERGCGNDAVDVRGLELTRQIRWELLSADAPSTLDWGMVEFFWATQPPAAPAGK